MAVCKGMGMDWFMLSREKTHYKSAAGICGFSFFKNYCVTYYVLLCNKPQDGMGKWVIFFLDHVEIIIERPKMLDIENL